MDAFIYFFSFYLFEVFILSIYLNYLFELGNCLFTILWVGEGPSHNPLTWSDDTSSGTYDTSIVIYGTSSDGTYDTYFVTTDIW